MWGFSDSYSIRPALPSFWQRVRFVQGPVTAERGHVRDSQGRLWLSRTCRWQGRSPLSTRLHPSGWALKLEWQSLWSPSRQLWTKEVSKAWDHFQNVPSYSFSAAGPLWCPPPGQTDPTGFSLPYPSLAPPCCTNLCPWPLAQGVLATGAPGSPRWESRPVTRSPPARLLLSALCTISLSCDTHLWYQPDSWRPQSCPRVQAQGFLCKWGREDPGSSWVLMTPEKGLQAPSLPLSATWGLPYWVKKIKRVAPLFL